MTAEHNFAGASSAYSLVGRIVDMLHTCAQGRKAATLIERNLDLIHRLLRTIRAVAELEAVGPNYGNDPMEVSYTSATGESVKERVWLGAIRLSDVYSDAGRGRSLDEFNPEQTRTMLQLLDVRFANEHHWKALANETSEPWRWQQYLIFDDARILVPMKQEVPALQAHPCTNNTVPNIDFYPCIIIVLKLEPM